MIATMIEFGAVGAPLGGVAAILLRRAFPPDDYAGDWYGWLVNQGGHVVVMLIGLIATVCFFAWWSEVPYQATLAWNFGLFSAAFQFVQWLQGGTFWDSVHDTAFMCYGSVGPSLLFKIEGDGLPHLVSYEAVGIFAAWVTLHFAYGAVRRLSVPSVEVGRPVADLARGIAAFPTDLVRAADALTRNGALSYWGLLFALFELAFFLGAAQYLLSGADAMPVQTWGSLATSVSPLFWAFCQFVGAVLILIGFTQPPKRWLIGLGAAIQIAQLSALSVSAYFYGGDLAIHSWNLRLFIPAHVIMLVGALRHDPK